METERTLERIFETEHRLEDARFALQQITADPRSTEAMRDGAYQTIANLADKLNGLNFQWDCEVAAWQQDMAGEDTPAITIAGRTFMEMPALIDVPGDVTYRDTRPVAGESDLQRAHRLAARAVIDGVRLYRHPAGQTAYATSASRHTLYAIDRARLTCSCPAQGLCKHLALYCLSAGIAHLLPGHRDPARRLVIAGPGNRPLPGRNDHVAQRPQLRRYDRPVRRHRYGRLALCR